MLAVYNEELDEEANHYMLYMNQLHTVHRVTSTVVISLYRNIVCSKDRDRNNRR